MRRVSLIVCILGVSLELEEMRDLIRRIDINVMSTASICHRNTLDDMRIFKFSRNKLFDVKMRGSPVISRLKIAKMVST